MSSLIADFAEKWKRPYFQYSENMGTRNGIFGARAGDCNVFNLAHEMAHAIQLKDSEFHSRFARFGRFSFPVKTQIVLGRFCYEPETDQISRRELETMVIQWIMMDRPDFEKFIKYIAELFPFLPDYWMFHQEALNGSKSKQFVSFVRTEFEKLLDKWSIENVKERWYNLPLELVATNRDV